MLFIEDFCDYNADYGEKSPYWESVYTKDCSKIIKQLNTTLDKQYINNNFNGKKIKKLKKNNYVNNKLKKKINIVHCKK